MGDYTLYDAATMKELDGGQFGVESIQVHPAPTQMDAAYREVCVLQGMEPDTVEEVPLGRLEDILSANEVPPVTIQEPAPLDTYPVPDNKASIEALSSTGYADEDMLPLSLNRAYEFMEDGFTVYHIDGGKASMCMDAEDLDSLPEGAILAIPREEWEQSHAFDIRIIQYLFKLRLLSCYVPFPHMNGGSFRSFLPLQDTR